MKRFFSKFEILQLNRFLELTNKWFNLDFEALPDSLKEYYYQKFQEYLQGKTITGYKRIDDYILSKGTLSHSYQDNLSIARQMQKFLWEGASINTCGFSEEKIQEINIFITRQILSEGSYFTSFEYLPLNLQNQILEAWKTNKPIPFIEKENLEYERLNPSVNKNLMSC